MRKYHGWEGGLFVHPSQLVAWRPEVLQRSLFHTLALEGTWGTMYFLLISRTCFNRIVICRNCFWGYEVWNPDDYRGICFLGNLRITSLHSVVPGILVSGRTYQDHVHGHAVLPQVPVRAKGKREWNCLMVGSTGCTVSPFLPCRAVCLCFYSKIAVLSLQACRMFLISGSIKWIISWAWGFHLPCKSSLACLHAHERHLWMAAIMIQPQERMAVAAYLQFRVHYKITSSF
jgi:hypothetical protein